MFGFFKKKPAAPTRAKTESGGPVLSVLLLEGDSYPLEALQRELAKKQIAGKLPTEMELGDKGILSFNLEGAIIALALMPAPYPEADLDGPISTTWMWPKNSPIQIVKRHRSFLLITMTLGMGNPVERRLVATAVTALAAEQPGVVAVYWPEGTLIHYPPLFVEMSKEMQSPELPPLYLWVDLRAGLNEDGTTALFTTGLTPLGHKEIEIPRIDMEVGEVREWLISIIYYLLEKGPILLDGQTIGMSADHQVKIRHLPSKFGHPGKVIRLEP